MKSLIQILQKDTLYIILIFFVSFPFFIFYTDSILSTEDEIALFYSAKLFVEGRNQNISTSLGHEFGLGFLPIFAVYKGIDEVYLRVFSTQTLFYAIFIRLFGPEAFFYISPLLGTIALIAVYLIIKKITRSGVLAIIAAVFLFSTPAFLKWSISHFTNIPFIAFFLLSLLLLLHNRYILAGIFFGLSFIVRPPDALLLLLPYFVFIWFNVNKTSPTKK